MEALTPFERSYMQLSRDTFDKEIAERSPDEDPSSFLEPIEGAIFGLNDYASRSNNPIPFIERSLSGIWHMFIELAKITHPQDHTQKSLVFLLLSTRALGSLSRGSARTDGEALTSRLTKTWADLSGFVPHLLEVWNRSEALSSVERVNLAAFTARLISIDMFGTEISACALWMLREGLETRADLASNEGTPGLVSACVTMLQLCGHQLLVLCINNATPHQAHQSLITPGDLAKHANVESVGFSMNRWLFWRQQFQVMSKAKDERVNKEGRRGFNAMVGCGREIGIKDIGESKYWDKVYSVLDAELQRGRKDSVGLDDIVTDPDWID